MWWKDSILRTNQANRVAEHLNDLSRHQLCWERGANDGRSHSPRRSRQPTWSSWTKRHKLWSQSTSGCRVTWSAVWWQNLGRKPPFFRSYLQWKNSKIKKIRLSDFTYKNWSKMTKLLTQLIRLLKVSRLLLVSKWSPTRFGRSCERSTVSNGKRSRS